MVLVLGLATKVANADFTFGTPTNLGPIINSSDADAPPNISADGLSLYFSSTQSGGFGYYDLWMTKRETTEDNWGTPVNLGAMVNSSDKDWSPSISADGLSLFFAREYNLWVTRRDSTSDQWRTAVSLGTIINSPARDATPTISDDGLSLFFTSERVGGVGDADIWVATRASKENDWSTPPKSWPNRQYPLSGRLAQHLS